MNRWLNRKKPERVVSHLSWLADQATIYGVSWARFNKAIRVNRLDRDMSGLAFKVMANEVMRGWR